jgi:hypothetical protein
MIVIVNQQQVHRRRSAVAARYALKGHFLNPCAVG